MWRLKTMKLTSWERNKLIPFRREIGIRARLEDILGENLRRFFRIRLLACVVGVTLDHPHPHGGHEVRIALARRIEIDFLEPALGIVTATDVLHLGHYLDHGCETQDGNMLGMILCEFRSEAGLVGQVVPFGKGAWATLLCAVLLPCL